ncbi:MAG: hypothetical protein HGB03_00135 [Candidatus Yonathbacteria bacterium]|nr:hypothetical protein [Candidatus Yonathbacteria bacterium]NTW48089.1 hypothetical protein [Candidatus Yonathbacteria bacterium]
MENADKPVQRNILICNFGDWGFMDRRDPSDAQCYNQQAEIIKEHLDNEFSVTVITERPQSADDYEQYSGVIFLTRGELETAIEVKHMCQNTSVIVLTGAPSPSERGVTIIDKDFRCNFLEKIVETFQQ